MKQPDSNKSVVPYPEIFFEGIVCGLALSAVAYFRDPALKNVRDQVHGSIGFAAFGIVVQALFLFPVFWIAFSLLYWAAAVAKRYAILVYVAGAACCCGIFLTHWDSRRDWFGLRWGALIVLICLLGSLLFKAGRSLLFPARTP